LTVCGDSASTVSVVTDALVMEGARSRGAGGGAVEALRAGVDLLLYPDDPPRPWQQH
jgi:beta-glucosidase-like glycosyl hydrolase